MIRNVTLDDAQAIGAIYNYYISNTIISFEEQPVTQEEMTTRISGTISDFPWLVFEEDEELLGYAYASKWKGRSAYRHSVEASVYLVSEATGKGIGTALYTELLARLRGMSIHTVVGGIALPNEASVALHEKFGFEKVAHFKEVGRKMDRWIDVGYWQLHVTE